MLWEKSIPSGVKVSVAEFCFLKDSPFDTMTKD